MTQVYTLGMVLKETETELVPNMEYVKAYGDQSSGKNQISIELENNVARVLENLTIEA